MCRHSDRLVLGRSRDDLDSFRPATLVRVFPMGINECQKRSLFSLLDSIAQPSGCIAHNKFTSIKISLSNQHKFYATN